MPSATATRGAATRAAILDTAASLATQEGLEPLSIGRLAEATEMSKSGLFAHFGSKEELQLATVDHAAALFRREVIDPAREAPQGVARVWALCERMVDYAERQVFPGGCFFASASAEFNNRPGQVRDAIAGALDVWLGELERQARAAGVGEPERLAFELYALVMGANSRYRLSGDRRVFGYARDSVEALLAELPE